MTLAFLSYWKRVLKVIDAEVFINLSVDFPDGAVGRVWANILAEGDFKNLLDGVPLPDLEVDLPGQVVPLQELEEWVGTQRDAFLPYSSHYSGRGHEDLLPRQPCRLELVHLPVNLLVNAFFLVLRQVDDGAHCWLDQVQEAASQKRYSTSSPAFFLLTKNRRATVGVFLLRPTRLFRLLRDNIFISILIYTSTGFSFYSHSTIILHSSA